MGAGAMTGRGLGRCFRRFSTGDELSAVDRKGLLQLHKDALKKRLADIDCQMESL